EAPQTGLGDAVEGGDVLSVEAPTQSAGVLLGLRRVLGAGDRNAALAQEPVESDLRRRAPAVFPAQPSELAQNRLDVLHGISGEVARSRRRVGGAVLAGESALPDRGIGEHDNAELGAGAQQPGRLGTRAEKRVLDLVGAEGDAAATQSGVHGADLGLVV